MSPYIASEMKPYEVVKGGDLTTVIDRINDFVLIGYRPIGGLTSNGSWWFQAMFKAPTKTPKVVTAHPRFEEWWKSYPTGYKKGKKTALVAWNKVKPHADTLIADVKNRAKNDQQWVGGFIPNPTTYLNQERWNDEINLLPAAAPSLPKDNADLEDWASAHGHRSPHPGEEYKDYRKYLQGKL